MKAVFFNYNKKKKPLIEITLKVQLRKLTKEVNIPSPYHPTKEK
jgi:hypothetical protein